MMMKIMKTTHPHNSPNNRPNNNKKKDEDDDYDDNYMKQSCLWLLKVV